MSCIPQCQAIAKSTQKQCKRNAQINDYCRQHYYILFPESTVSQSEEELCMATKRNGKPCNHPKLEGDYCGYHVVPMKRKTQSENKKLNIKREVIDKVSNNESLIKYLTQHLKNMVLKEDTKGNATVELHFESITARNVFEEIKGLSH
jgi:hypothetical protein